MAYDKDLDVVTFEINVPDTNLVISIHSYNGGEPKIALSVQTNTGRWPAKRISMDDWRRVWDVTARTPALGGRAPKATPPRDPRDPRA